MISLYTSEYFKSILPEQLARIITERREYLNISQIDLAVRCHLSEHMIKKMEKGMMETMNEKRMETFTDMVEDIKSSVMETFKR